MPADPNDDLRHQRDAYEDALTDLAHIARGEMPDPWPADEPKPDDVGGRAYAAVCELVRERDALRARLVEAGDDYVRERDDVSRLVRERDDLQARLVREAATHAAREGELSQRVADLQGQLRDADATAVGLRDTVRAAVARANEAEARLDALHERIATADVPWRLPGCECPVDSKPADRCDSRWTRCNARLSYQRAVKATGAP